MPPSELLGISCEFCAYCFDEALIVRRSVLEGDERDKAEHVSKTEQNRGHLRSVLAEAPGV